MAEPQQQATEFAYPSHPDVVAFLVAGTQPATGTDEMKGSQDEDARRQFAEMDGSMIRVIEDLLDVLLGKHLILLTDLPMDAQRKLLARKETRRSLLGDAAGMTPPTREIF